MGRLKSHTWYEAIRPSRAGAGDLIGQVRVPPDVEGVDDHADGRRRVRRGQVQGLPQGGDHGAVGGVHRVQRLQHQPDAVLGRVRHQLGDPVGHPLAGGHEILVAVRQAADDHDQLAGAEGGRLDDGAPGCRPARPADRPGRPRSGTRRGTGWTRSVRTSRDQSRGLCPGRPRPPGRATARCGTARPLARPRPPRPGSTAWWSRCSATAGRSRTPRQCSTPLTASRSRIRRAASSGSSSRPARSASRKASDQVRHATGRRAARRPC